ncbi:MAG: YfcE family phosphodiesterase [archaeon]
MEKIAVLGDSHFPGRARELPARLLEEARKFSPDRIILTGDANSGDVLKRLSEICLRVEGVKGEKDYLEFPIELVFSVGKISFGVVHGDFAKPAGNLAELESYGRSLGVQVLISGHSHKRFVGRGEKLLLLNPGSLTGVPLPGEDPENPSLLLLTVDEKEFQSGLSSLSEGRLSRLLRNSLSEAQIKRFINRVFRPLDMVKRPRGPRSKTRYKMKKSSRERGVPSVSKIVKKLAPGTVVSINIEPAMHKGLPPIVFQGLTGKVIEQRGRDGYVVEFRQGKALKNLVTTAVHLKEVGK